MSKKYYFADKNDYYSHEIDGVEGELPPLGAILSPPPPEPWDHVWPRWDGTKWELAEDHRKREYTRAQEATEYWLPGDQWDSPARTMTEIGPLPEGAMLTAPTKPQPSVTAKAAHLADVRYKAEQGSTVWSGHTLQTDDRSQSKYLAELAAIDQGVRADPSPWKLTDGFVMASNDDIKAMAIAARAHVMACFAAEATILPGLNDLLTLDAVSTAFAAALTQIKEASNA